MRTGHTRTLFAGVSRRQGRPTQDRPNTGYTGPQGTMACMQRGMYAARKGVRRLFFAVRTQETGTWDACSWCATQWRRRVCARATVTGARPYP